MRTVVGVLFASLLVVGVCSSKASAESLSMAFTEARANVGVQLSDAALFAAPETAPFEAQIDPGSGSVTAGVLQVPQFSTHITDPIDADVTVDFEIGVITGSFTAAGGALSLEGEAGGTLTATGKECTVSTTPAVLELSTEGSSGGASPRSGALFAHGLTGAGAIAGQWTDMQATPVDPEPGGDTIFCEDVEDQIEGPGGIWLWQQGDVVPPGAPQLTNTNPPSPSPSGTPRLRGTAEAGSTVRIYAGSDCAGSPLVTGSADELRSPGLLVEVPEGATVDFSATATDAAGNSSICSAPVTYTRLFLDQGIRPQQPPCVVPNLVGKKPKAAKRRIRAAGCTVGRILKPKHLQGPGGRRLVVKASTPVAGAIIPANGKVHIRLGLRARA